MAWISREHYIAYLRSEKWRLIRQNALRRAKFCCERCSAKGFLDVHHKHYRTLGDESLDDVEVVCRTCHGKADEERAQQGRNRAYDAALDGWATKAYGEDWHERFDEGNVADDFDRWRDGQ